LFSKLLHNILKSPSIPPLLFPLLPLLKGGDEGEVKIPLTPPLIRGEDERELKKGELKGDLEGWGGLNPPLWKGDF